MGDLIFVVVLLLMWLLGDGSLTYRYGYTVLRCCVVLVYDFVGSSYRVVFPALECIPLLLNSLSLKLWYLTSSYHRQQGTYHIQYLHSTASKGGSYPSVPPLHRRAVSLNHPDQRASVRDVIDAVPPPRVAGLEPHTRQETPGFGIA